MKPLARCDRDLAGRIACTRTSTVNFTNRGRTQLTILELQYAPEHGTNEPADMMQSKRLVRHHLPPAMAMIIGHARTPWGERGFEQRAFSPPAIEREIGFPCREQIALF
jgi:hypothetical protein